MILKELPKGSKEQDSIAEDLYNQMVAREEDLVVRMNKVVEFATKDDCESASRHYFGHFHLAHLAHLALVGLAQALASYFGDDDAVPNLGMCGSCTFCKTSEAVNFTRTTASLADPIRIKRVLAACLHRDDPRLLARLAFGITSPRLTAAKLTRDPVFGSMDDVAWSALMEAFTKACEEGGNLPAVENEASAAHKLSYGPTKRPLNNGPSSSGGRGSGGGRGRGGGGSKRGRYQ